MDVAGRFSGKRCSRMEWVAIALLLAIGVPVSMAQLPTATIFGIVKDASGAVVPGVSLSVRNTETGQSRNAVSGGDGSYRFPALPVGPYEVRAEHSGFRAEVQSGLTLTVSQEAVVNFTLEVGGVEQTVEVTAQAPLVNTTSGSLGGLVNEDRIADLPLNGRNYADLTLLQAGVTQNRNTSTGGQGVGNNISSNGATLFSNNYLLDGAMMVNYFGTSSSSATGTTLGVDGIREFRVVTNSFSAEYGMRMGSQTIIVTKSGTNTFHGSAFEFLRNSVLDARNFFDYTTSTTPGRLPAFKRNNFGGSFGGPVKKDKTFFFGVYEGLRERKGLTSVINSIPAGCRGAAGAMITNTACPQLSVPSVTVAPVIAPFLPFFPVPNLPAGQYTFPFSQPTTDNYGQVRLDQTISSIDTAFARYTVDDTVLISPISYPQFPRSRGSRNQYLTLSENHIFSASLLNTFRGSFSRTTIAQAETEADPTQFFGPQFAFLPGQETGNLNVAGLTSAWGPSSGVPQFQTQNIFTWSDDVFYTKGRHALKFGTLINHFQDSTISTSARLRGMITFANLTQFLLGQPSSYNAGTPGSIVERAFHFNTVGFYVQDDLRMSSKFTLNLGLRYEFNTTFNETHNKYATLRDLRSDVTTTVGPPFQNPSLHNFGPRVGFAWDVKGDGRTAVRGGFGLLYDNLSNVAGILNNNTCMAPFCSNSTVSNPPPLTLPLVFSAAAAGKTLAGLDYHLQQPHMLQYNLTVERQLPGDIALTVGYAGSRGMNLMEWAEGNPTVPLILPNGQPFWTGTEARINPNWGSIELHTAAGDSWYNALQVGLVKRLTKGLQFQSSYTWSKAIDTNEAYLGGDFVQTEAISPYPTNKKLERGLAGFDIAQVFHFNAIYNFPKVSGAAMMGKLLNGWSTGGILSLQTGPPFDVQLQTQRSRSGVLGGGNPTGYGSASDRPDLVPGRNNSNITSGTSAGCAGVPAGQKVGTPNLWYDPCAFTVQQAGFLGTAGRNILRGPGLANLDFSLTKDTALSFLGEGGKLQFRADIFNLLNHPNFITPALGATGSNSGGIVFAGNAVGNPALATAGVITATTTTSRQLQLSLRLIF